MLKRIGNAVPPLSGRAAWVVAHRALDLMAGVNLRTSQQLPSLYSATDCSLGS